MRCLRNRYERKQLFCLDISHLRVVFYCLLK
ncbi:hypothetical protein [Caudoviricetes sp.]|nr:hypothetical protein [Caudoviricetes sp.]